MTNHKNFQLGEKFASSATALLYKRLLMIHEVLAYLKPLDTAKSHNIVSKHWSFSQIAGPVFALQEPGTSNFSTLIQITQFHATNLQLQWEPQNCCYGWLPTTFCINTYQSSQLLYICNKVDNLLLNSIEQAFYHTWSYLYLYASNDIVINNQKSQFYKKTMLHYASHHQE